VLIESPDSNKVYIYDSNKTTYRNVGTQFGSPSLELRRSTRTQPNTPVKDQRKRKLRISEVPELMVGGLPGKKKKVKPNESNESSRKFQKKPVANTSSKAAVKSQTTKSTPQTKPKSIPQTKPQAKLQAKPQAKSQTKTQAKAETKQSTTKSSKSVVRSGRCKVCDVVYDSKEDTNLRKLKGRKASWVGCDFKLKRCQYWGHACCVSVVINPRKRVEEHSFLCPQHRAK